MARITSEVAANKIGNRYEMILIAARRARELRRGWRCTVNNEGHNEIVSALKEIETGAIGREYLRKPPMLKRDERPETDSQS